MKTTFREIKNFSPCKKGWIKLMELNPENDMDKEITILEILNHNGVKDAFWALRTQDYRDYCLILADIAESVLHIFEEKYPEDKRPREAIDAIRLWSDKKITNQKLACSAAAAAAAASNAAAYAADYNAAYNVAYAAAYNAAYAAANAASNAAYAAAYDAVYDAAPAADATQWVKNEEILRKHLQQDGGMMREVGIKHDSGKLRWDLMPMDIWEHIVWLHNEFIEDYLTVYQKIKLAKEQDWCLLAAGLLMGTEDYDSILGVITEGAKKYGDNSWQLVENAEQRYFAALMRHLDKEEEINADDFNLPHSAHAVVNCIFLQWFENKRRIR
jgi:hypothetical protein